MSWVEKGEAPHALIARQAPSQDLTRPAPANQTSAAVRTRPIFPYPLTSRYVGSGSPDDAANFVAGTENRVPAALLQWMGARFYTPGYQTWCTDTANSIRCKRGK
jgi:feruloyl esterase